MMSPIIEEVEENTRTINQNKILTFLAFFFALNLEGLIEDQTSRITSFITICLLGFLIILAFGVYFNIKNIQYGLYAFIIFNLISDLIILDLFMTIMPKIPYYDSQLQSTITIASFFLVINIVISVVFVFLSHNYALEMNNKHQN